MWGSLYWRRCWLCFVLFTAFPPLGWECVTLAASNGQWDGYLNLISQALAEHTPCTAATDGTAGCHGDVIERDLAPWRARGITKADIERAGQTQAVHYQIIGGKLYRTRKCMFGARCEGVEHFLLPLARQLPDMDIMINVYDHPQVNKYSQPSPVFSFSRDSSHADIMYPAWTFWSGGPAVWPIYPVGLGEWHKQRDLISKKGDDWPWEKKVPKAFFRGSRTSRERDPLILFSRNYPEFAEAAYTKNQAYRSKEDTLGAEPAEVIPLEDHCKYKYLFNFRGVAASFRLKHLFLCRSLVLHVGEEWLEFFYPALKPWVHYVPLATDLSDLENVMEFLRSNDKVAQEIAERGYAFIWEHLRVQDVEEYWRQLLSSYADALRYKAVLSKDMIEVEQGVHNY